MESDCNSNNTRLKPKIETSKNNCDDKNNCDEKSQSQGPILSASKSKSKNKDKSNENSQSIGTYLPSTNSHNTAKKEWNFWKRIFLLQ